MPMTATTVFAYGAQNDSYNRMSMHQLREPKRISDGATHLLHGPKRISDGAMHRCMDQKESPTGPRTAAWTKKNLRRGHAPAAWTKKNLRREQTIHFHHKITSNMKPIKQINETLHSRFSLGLQSW